MFGFLKQKVKEIKSPAKGKIIAIEEVEDDVFSQKMVGDGVAIIPTSSEFTAPIDGVITKIFPTNHAYSIKHKKNLEVMVHIGLDTVTLEGKGFERIAQEGDEVKAGDVIIKVDLAYIKQYAKDIVTPIIISDESDVKEIEKVLSEVKNQDVIMKVK